MKRVLFLIAIAAVVAVVYFNGAVTEFLTSLRNAANQHAAGSASDISDANSDTQPQTNAQLAASMAQFRALPHPAACRNKKVLVLYDTSGEWGYLGELDAIFTANLVGRWADYAAVPVSQYQAGDVGKHDLTIYIGTTFDEKLPAALVEDIGETRKPVLWVNYGIDALADQMRNFSGRYGFTIGTLDHGSFKSVAYRGVDFTRQDVPGGADEGQLMTVHVQDSDQVKVLARAQRGDGGEIPWAVRSGNLTYVAEDPFQFTNETDRYLIFADLLTGLLAPDLPQTHDALMRIEDVGADADPEKLRALADYLYSRHVPFSVATYDAFRDPLDTDPSQPRATTLAETPAVVEALKYMAAHGGTLIMHGHTHQLAAIKNPYSAKSAADFEFFRAHVDDHNSVNWDGPDSRDSREWAAGRVNDALADWAAAGLPRPTIFEFPHYAGSALDYAAVASLMSARYEHSMYFTGTLQPQTADHMRFSEQFFPYPVRDVYGSIVLPEDMGDYAPYPFNQNPARSPAQLLAAADHDWVLSGGVASFFFHWFFPPDRLKEIIEPMQAKGWTFVTPGSVVSEMQCK